MKNISHPLFRIFVVAILTGFLSLNLSAQSETTQDKKVSIAKELLKSYAGDYEMNPGSILKIVYEGDSIKAVGPDRVPVQLKPIKENLFYLKKFGVDIEFVKGQDGKIEKLLMIRGDGQTLEAKKVIK
ncbi:hypothetical protein [Roseivirga echinicomitans]|uniref:Peptidase S12 Pab87-related C-terminal domain-containing protein n=1 Tax=Roseivirga echinicomitans TaxID=296218 RepID=A0A150X9L3_9BACT|nr:hypothetical protein [Roseivirga echinicomitans]KYG75408.1 hypothetical protein AWN68_07620 [Roseivirga echinicomitans]